MKEFLAVLLLTLLIMGALGAMLWWGPEVREAIP